MTRLLAAAVLAATLAGPSRVSVSISPTDVLLDQPVTVRVTGLRPRERIFLQASTIDVGGRAWRSRVAYRADGHGLLDTRGDMRIAWLMQRVGAAPGNADHLALTSPSTVAVTVLRRTKAAGRASFVRRTSADGVQHSDLTVDRDGLAGTFYRRPGSPRRTAVLMLGGSAGGHGGAITATLLASHGFPTLSLGYFAEPGLSEHLQNIPLEYFQGALRWLATQSEVDPSRMVVAGVSRGGELALLLASTYPDLVHGAVACTTAAQILGGDPSGRAWTIGGSPVPFEFLPVDRITVPTLITGAGQDEIIESGPATTQLLQFAHAHGRTNVTGHVYAKAGHGVGCGPPNLPAPGIVESRPGTFLSLGGSLAGNGEAAAAAWPRLLRFLAAV
jgi:dienelactone hydrolase